MKHIQLGNNRGIALVDDEDYEELSSHKWYILQENHTAYAVTNIKRNDKRTSLRMHRLIMGEPESMDVDHEDGNGLNNQRYNLRICTSSQNKMNQRKTRGSSQYKGVSLYKKTNQWRAMITKDGKFYFLGYRDSEIEAAKLYDDAALKYFGNFANLNFPKEIQDDNKQDQVGR